MKTTIKRWGNSAGLPLPKVLLKHLHADIGANIEVKMIDDGLLIKRVKAPQYSLEKLLSFCTLQNTRLATEDIAWLHDKSKGKEI